MGIKRQAQVMVVGAGPVGLYAALSLAERGVDVEIIDKEWRGALNSYALALHPQTLRLLDECGVLDELMPKGHRIDKLAFYSGDDRAAELDLSRLAGPFGAMLVLPQSALELALEDKLKQNKVNVLWNYRAQAIEERERDVKVTVAQLEKTSSGYPIARSEWLVRRERDVAAEFVVGADGYHSRVRDAIGSRFEPLGKPSTFVVFEFTGKIGFQHEGRVVINDNSTNVVWPLDEERGRWNFQVDADDLPPLTVESLEQLIRTRAPWFDSRIEKLNWTATVTFEPRRVDLFGRDRIWLAGDAAHVTGPVGAQSMNVGIREAHDLAERFSALLKTGGNIGSLEEYAAERHEEWKSLQETPGVEATAEVSPWVREFASRILPCIPASGEDLDELLEQFQLQLN